MPGIKGRSGRKPSNKSRFIRVTILVNPAEYAAWQARAGIEPLSVLIRMAVNQFCSKGDAK